MGGYPGSPDDTVRFATVDRHPEAIVGVLRCRGLGRGQSLGRPSQAKLPLAVARQLTTDGRRMSRPRALLALMLALAWCSAAWHCDLEAAELLLEHDHHAHSDQGGQHESPSGAHDDHEEVFARDVVKDQVRIGSGATLWFVVFGLALWLPAASRPDRGSPGIRRQRRETGPPLARVWQFVQRCAPQSAAPPALG